MESTSTAGQIMSYIENERNLNELNYYLYRRQAEHILRNNPFYITDDTSISVDDLLTEGELERPIHEQLIELRHSFIAKYGILPTHAIINHEDYQKLRYSYEVLMGMPAEEGVRFANMEIKVVSSGEPHVGILMESNDI